MLSIISIQTNLFVSFFLIKVCDRIVDIEATDRRLAASNSRQGQRWMPEVPPRGMDAVRQNKKPRQG
jgi:hypothetical protein